MDLLSCRHNFRKVARCPRTGCVTVGNLIDMAAVRLKEVIEVMKYYYRQDVGDMTHSLLLGSLDDAPIKVFSVNTSTTFGVGQLPYMKTVNDGEGTSKQVLMEWDEVPNKKSKKCILFYYTALNNATLDVEVESNVAEEPWRTATITRKQENVQLYDEIVAKTWKGLRVLPCDEYIFSDSEGEEPSEGDHTDGHIDWAADVDAERAIKRLKKHSRYNVEDLSPDEENVEEFIHCCEGCGVPMSNGSQMCSSCVRNQARY